MRSQRLINAGFGLQEDTKMADRWLLSRLAFENMPYDCCDALSIVVEICHREGKEGYTKLLETVEKAIRAMNPDGLKKDVPIMENFTAIVKARSRHPALKLVTDLVGANEEEQLRKVSRKIGANLSGTVQDGYYGIGFGEGDYNIPNVWILLSRHNQTIQVRVDLNAYGWKVAEKLKPFMDELEKGELRLRALKAALDVVAFFPN